MFKHFLQKVPLSKIRYNNLPVYEKEGYGGAPIEKWPMYAFFREYVAGQTESSEINFENWYRDQLLKYQATPKRIGGMYQGSLYDLIEKRCQAPYEKVSGECKDKAIKERVGQRFKLLDEIQEKGYLADIERIDAVRKKGLIYLKGGHHRAAILLALGQSELPGVLVFPNEVVYNLFCFLRNIK